MDVMLCSIGAVPPFGGYVAPHLLALSRRVGDREGVRALACEQFIDDFISGVTEKGRIKPVTLTSGSHDHTTSTGTSAASWSNLVVVEPRIDR